MILAANRLNISYNWIRSQQNAGSIVGIGSGHALGRHGVRVLLYTHTRLRSKKERAGKKPTMRRPDGVVSCRIDLESTGVSHCKKPWVGSYCTVCQADVSATLACASKGLEKGLVSKKILIVSDSQATLVLVKGYQLNSKLI